MIARREAPEPRGRYQGVRQILAYNRRFYLLTLAGAAAALLASAWLPMAARLAVYAAVSAAFFWTFSSLLVSHYIYDRSSLYDLSWIRAKLLHPPQRWVSIHAGLDETSPFLAELFPGAEGRVLDIYDRSEMTEPSIARARRLGKSLPSEAADFRDLPLPSGGCDAVFLIFAAHEIRGAASRATFFAEIARILHPDGAVILIEHLRDLPNFIAFGPGFLHFLPRREWLRASEAAGLVRADEFSITAFVHVLCLRKSI